MKNSKSVMNTIGIVFARLDSQRFPGKALSYFQGIPLVLHILQRASLSRELSQIVLATTRRTEDDLLAHTVKKHNFPVFRGDYEDLGRRALDCATHFGADAFARLNGDSPALDIPLLDTGVRCMREKGASFVTNLLPVRTYPYGVAVEIVKTAFFSPLCSQERSNQQKEHFTTILYDTCDQASIFTLPACEVSCPHVHLTVDTPDDLDRVEQIYPRIEGHGGGLVYKVFPELPEYLHT